MSTLSIMAILAILTDPDPACQKSRDPDPAFFYDKGSYLAASFISTTMGLEYLGCTSFTNSSAIFCNKKWVEEKNKFPMLNLGNMIFLVFRELPTLSHIVLCMYVSKRQGVTKVAMSGRSSYFSASATK